MKRLITKNDYSSLALLAIGLLVMFMINFFESTQYNTKPFEIINPYLQDNSVKTDATDPNVRTGLSYYEPLYTQTPQGQALSGIVCHMVREGGFQWPFCNLELPLTTELDMTQSKHFVSMVINVTKIEGSDIFRIYLESTHPDAPVYSQIVRLKVGKNVINFSDFGLSQWWIENHRYTTNEGYSAPVLSNQIAISTSPYLLQGGKQTVQIKQLYLIQQRLSPSRIRQLNIIILIAIAFLQVWRELRRIYNNKRTYNKYITALHIDSLTGVHTRGKLNEWLAK